MQALDVPLQPIIGEPELTIAWLAQRGLLPTKTDWGRYTIAEGEQDTSLSHGAKLLIIDNLEIRDDEDLAAIRRQVRSHPRWPDQ